AGQRRSPARAESSCRHFLRRERRAASQRAVCARSSHARHGVHLFSGDCCLAGAWVAFTQGGCKSERIHHPGHHAEPGGPWARYPEQLLARLIQSLLCHLVELGEGDSVFAFALALEQAPIGLRQQFFLYVIILLEPILQGDAALASSLLATKHRPFLSNVAHI